MSVPMQLTFSFASPVPYAAKRGAKARGSGKWAWVEASVWTKRMLAALDNGVKGGKRPCTGSLAETVSHLIRDDVIRIKSF
jgi:hypothetical protein